MGKNDQLIRTVPGTDVGGKDTAGVDGEERTERPGEILGTPNPDAGTKRTTAAARELETKRGDYVRDEVDRANREELPKLGGNVEDTWSPGDDKGKRTAAARPARTAAPAPTPATTTAKESDDK